MWFNSGVAFLGGIVEAPIFKSSVTELSSDPCLIKKDPLDIKDIHHTQGHMSQDRRNDIFHIEWC